MFWIIFDNAYSHSKTPNLVLTLKIVSSLDPSILFSPFYFAATYVLRYQSISQPLWMPLHRHQTMLVRSDSSQIISNRHQSTQIASTSPQMCSTRSKDAYLSLPLAYKLITDAIVRRPSIKACLPSSIGYIISSKVLPTLVIARE